MVNYKYWSNDMKTTIEIPDPLFRQAKARAAMEGLSLRDLFLRGLQLSLQTHPTVPARQRANFPLLHAVRPAPPLTDEQVYLAMNNDDELS
jgi:hypothetical protein